MSMAPTIFNHIANTDKLKTKSTLNQFILSNKYTIKLKNTNQIKIINKLKNTCEKATCFLICFHHKDHITAVNVVHK